MDSPTNNKTLCIVIILAAIYLLHVLNSNPPQLQENFYGTYINVDGFPQYAPIDSKTRPIWVYGAGKHYHTSPMGKESHLYRNAPLPKDYVDYSK